MSSLLEADDWLGRTTTTVVTLSPGPANRLASTLDRETTFKVGDVLPAAWHWLYFHEVVAASDVGLDGHPRLGVTMPPSKLTRRMWAAGQIEFVTPLELGKTVERTSTIRSITPKSGRSGELLFVSVEHDLRVDGISAVREQQTIVYRDPAAPAGGASFAAPTDEDFADTWQLDNVTLFRYSALTFNSHRIHYDADYARDAEGYPGLVVHGPLLVTLLLDAAAQRDIDVAEIRYRAVSPVFLPDAFTVNGRRDDGEVALWATSATGQLAMKATVTPRQENNR
jgi:3-methylfumaryl-CoA hydratase